MKNLEFKDVLREFLKENHLTQSKFAESTGVKQSQVSEWIHGKAKPGYDTLKTFSTVYNVPADYWLGIIDEY